MWFHFMYGSFYKVSLYFQKFGIFIPPKHNWGNLMFVYINIIKIERNNSFCIGRYIFIKSNCHLGKKIRIVKNNFILSLSAQLIKRPRRKKMIVLQIFFLFHLSYRRGSWVYGVWIGLVWGYFLIVTFFFPK